ncbi:MAG: NADH-quinone oxidoreductase subunit G [Legionella sp.]|nr:NADH-quinone oxidoreductase subunit G [Legionella sp.]
MARIEIDGKTFEIESGKMIIEAADEAGIYIPRFCYHKKLSIAANCRMCLVEVANSRKPVPACATPVSDGMKVFTKSKEALYSQRAVMEFLLINHPLDCPICDQGGECELQDLSMGFGYASSEYIETKRAVDDDDLGTLVATDMTRCIHCTRCVRFGEEVSGLRELGATGRGENMQIGTYVQHSLRSEVSGNIIDLCPVGALTSKPFRYQARAWEMNQSDSVAPHDCLGSNVHLHVRRNELLRVVPRENEAINEVWLSDRDRFSYLGLNHTNRASRPMIKRDGQWETVDWETALTFTTESLQQLLKQHGSDQLAAFASPSSTLEECYLLQKLMRSLGVNHLDHRLHQVDFRDQTSQPTMPKSSLLTANLETRSSILLFGCNIHREVPLAALRIRKASRNGAPIFAINPVDYDHRFDLADKQIVSPQEMPGALAALLSCLADEQLALPEEVQKLLVGMEPDETIQRMANALRQPNSAIVTGAIAANHPEAALLRTLLYWLEQTGIQILRLTTGANAAGAALAGMLPHRTTAGKTVESAGMNVKEALEAQLKGYFLLAVEPGYDFANPYGARRAMLGAELVVMLTAFYDESMRDYADIILPIAPYAETSGTYINVDQQWQPCKGQLKPHAEARPAWKILRVLGNLLGCQHFDYTSSEDVLNEIKLLAAKSPDIRYTPYCPTTFPSYKAGLTRVGEWPLYRSDMIVRHAEPLQACAAADEVAIRVHPSTAEQLRLRSDTATVAQGEIKITLPLIMDKRVAPDVVWIVNAMPETSDLGHAFDVITLSAN